MICSGDGIGSGGGMTGTGAVVIDHARIAACIQANMPEPSTPQAGTFDTASLGVWAVETKGARQSDFESGFSIV
jgi:hypothetical protein